MIVMPMLTMTSLKPPSPFKTCETGSVLLSWIATSCSCSSCRLALLVQRQPELLVRPVCSTRESGSCSIWLRTKHRFLESTIVSSQAVWLRVNDWSTCVRIKAVTDGCCGLWKVMAPRICLKSNCKQWWINMAILWIHRILIIRVLYTYGWFLWAAVSKK